MLGGGALLRLCSYARLCLFVFCFFSSLIWLRTNQNVSDMTARAEIKVLGH